MKRREFITLVGGAAAAWPRAARAQEAAKQPTIGFLGGGTPSSQSQWAIAFAQRLRELGWIDGRTVAIEYRWGEGRVERYAEIAAEFVRLNVDVILAGGTEVAIAAKQTTSVIPIVFSVAETRSAASWSLHWLDRAVTSPACQISEVISLPSALNSCVRFPLVCVGWPLWLTATIQEA